MKCEVCGQEVDKRVFWQKYCSPACRQEAWALRRMDERKKKGGKANEKNA